MINYTESRVHIYAEWDSEGGHFVKDGEAKTHTYKNHFLKSSSNPRFDLEILGSRNQYHPGYEFLFEEIPTMEKGDPLLRSKANLTRDVLEKISESIISEDWLKNRYPGDGGFARTVIGLETPKVGPRGPQEGSEIIVAHWGTHFSSPVHGHAAGYMHEGILSGKIRVNTYRMTDPDTNKVRLVSTEIVTRGTFVSEFHEGEYAAKRPFLIHNFTALEPTNTIHFLPEHTRDGKDNAFVPEYFEDAFQLEGEYTRISGNQALYSLKIGDVVLVRSLNVPEYGDHFIVITGPNVLKEHGLRPQDTAILSPFTFGILDGHDYENGTVLLKLNEKAKAAFHDFHSITMAGPNVVIFPEPTPLSHDKQ